MDQPPDDDFRAFFRVLKWLGLGAFKVTLGVVMLGLYCQYCGQLAVGLLILTLVAMPVIWVWSKIKG